MQKNSGKKKEKCKNCEGKGLIKNGDKKMKCQRCGGTGFKPRSQPRSIRFVTRVRTHKLNEKLG